MFEKDLSFQDLPQPCILHYHCKIKEKLKLVDLKYTKVRNVGGKGGGVPVYFVLQSVPRNMTVVKRFGGRL